jgi:hypothetical protein
LGLGLGLGLVAVWMQYRHVFGALGSRVTHPQHAIVPRGRRLRLKKTQSGFDTYFVRNQTMCSKLVTKNNGCALLYGACDDLGA